jgi:uncharacterized membrane protein
MNITEVIRSIFGSLRVGAIVSAVLLALIQAVCSQAGINITPETQQAIVAAIVSLLGLAAADTVRPINPPASPPK